MKNLKILGLAFVAMLAIGATAVPAASAVKMTAEGYPTTLTGASDPGIGNVVAVTAGNVSCPNSTYLGVLAAASTTVSVAPNFTGCTAFGFPGTMDVNECTLLLHGVEASFNSTVDFVCPAGKEMTLTVTSAGTSKCMLHIPSQAGLGTVTVTPVGAGATREITLDVNVTGIKYTHTAGSGLGACASGSGTNGTLTAKTLLTGENGGGTHVGIFPTL
jgi:hypothetical protein